ncbi:MAG: LysR family transcriptional regulator [Bdellovibrionales bacterium]
MELTWIEDFLALARTQNFTEAANQRHTTQSAFSRRIQQLEQWLGTQLFDRETRPVKLTEGGEDFYRRAQRLREDMLDARRIAMASQTTNQQAERIFTTTALAVGVAPGWLKKSGLTGYSIFTSSTAGCLEALHQKRADQILLPLFPDAEKDPQLRYSKITDDRLVLVQHKQAKNSLVCKGKKLSGPLMMYTPGTIFGQQLTQRWLSLGLECSKDDIMCESSSAETLLALVQQGMGAAWVPQSLGGNVVRCDVPDKLDVPYDVMLVTRVDDDGCAA